MQNKLQDSRGIAKSIALAATLSLGILRSETVRVGCEFCSGAGCIEREEYCSVCGGDGYELERNINYYPYGYHRWRVRRWNRIAYDYARVQCSSCGGRGKKQKIERCRICGGSGKVTLGNKKDAYGRMAKAPGGNWVDSNKAGYETGASEPDVDANVWHLEEDKLEDGRKKNPATKAIDYSMYNVNTNAFVSYECQFLRKCVFCRRHYRKNELTKQYCDCCYKCEEMRSAAKRKRK